MFIPNPDILYIRPFNQSYFEIYTLNSKIFKQIQRRFSYKYTYYKQRKPKTIEISLIQANKYVPIGLYYEFIEFLNASNILYDITEEIIKKNKFKYENLLWFINCLKLSIEPYQYQIDAVYDAIINGRNIILSPTSSGKSLIMAILAMFYYVTRTDNKKVLILVPNKGLVTQLFFEFMGYFRNNPQINCHDIIQPIHGDMPKNQIDLSKPIIISTWQSEDRTSKTFFNQFNMEYLQEIGMLIYDEVHLASATVSKEITSSCVNTKFKIGLTGTLHDDEQEYKNALIKGLFGEIISSISIKEMILGGYSADICIYHLLFDFGVFERKFNYYEELEYIHNNKEFMKYIVEFTIHNLLEGNTIILYKSLEYGQRLKRLFERVMNSKDIHMINGSVDAFKRNEIRKVFEHNTGQVLLGTYDTVSTGFSIKNLHYGVMLESMKSRVKVLQTLGRLLRKHDSKKKAYLFDIVPVLQYIRKNNKGDTIQEDGYVYKHHLKRIEYFEKEQLDYKIKLVENWKKSIF